MKVEESFMAFGFPINSEYPVSGIMTELSYPDNAGIFPIFKKILEWELSME